MKITLLDKTNVKYNGYYLEQFQTYNDIDDKTANDLINSGDAKAASDSIQGVSYETATLAPKTPDFSAKENGGYVAEAKLSANDKAKLEAEGKVDDTPVIGKDKTLPKDTTPEPVEKTEVLDANGKPLSEDEIKKREAAAAAGAKDNSSAKVDDLQNSGQEVK